MLQIFASELIIFDYFVTKDLFSDSKIILFGYTFLPIKNNARLTNGGGVPYVYHLSNRGVNGNIFARVFDQGYISSIYRYSYCLGQD